MRRIKVLVITICLTALLTGCGAKVTVKTTKFKIIDVSASSSGVVLALLDEQNNRITRHVIQDDYKFNCDFKIESKQDLIGKYFYGNAYGTWKIDTVIKSN